MIVSKKKRKFWRAIMLCGIAIFLVGGCMTIGMRSGSILVAIAGILVAFVGARGVDSLYRCPHCGKKLLTDGDRDDFSGKCPKHCPHCLAEINVVES